MRSAAEELEGVVMSFVVPSEVGTQLLHFSVTEAFCALVTRSIFDLPLTPPFIPIATGVPQGRKNAVIVQNPLSALSSYAFKAVMAAGQSLVFVHARATTLIRINPSVVFRDRFGVDLAGPITTSSGFGLIRRVIRDPGLSHHRNCCACCSCQGSSDE